MDGDCGTALLQSPSPDWWVQPVVGRGKRRWFTGETVWKPWGNHGETVQNHGETVGNQAEMAIFHGETKGNQAENG